MVHLAKIWGLFSKEAALRWLLGLGFQRSERGRSSSGNMQWMTGETGREEGGVCEKMRSGS